MSFRSSLPLILGLAVLAGAACEEFPDPLNTDAGQIPVTIQPVDWPAELALGDNTTLEVEVVDGQGRAVQAVTVGWSITGAGSLGSGQGLTRDLTGTALGTAVVTVSISQDPFVDTQLEDSIPVLLDGMAISVPAADTTLTALDDQMALSAEGLDVNNTAQSGSGIHWEIASGSAVSFTSSVDADQTMLQAVQEGTAVVVASNPNCVSTAVCTDTVRITVDQRADSVALTTRSDTLVASDTLQISASTFDGNGNDAPTETVTWSSRNPSVATVDGAGQVVAQGAGQTWIVASAGSGADSASITVHSSGVLMVDLTDAPADLLASAELFLGGVYVTDNAVTQGRRYLLDSPLAVDLLTLADTVAALGAKRVPTGTYNGIWLVVDSARITLLTDYVFTDATRTRTFTLTPDTVAAVITGGATFTGNDTVRVVLDFDVDGSFPMPQPTDSVVNSVSFDPTTRVVERTLSASIAGAVTTGSTPSVADLTVRAIRTDVTDTLFTRTDAGGAFKFRYLQAGSYDLSIPRAPACHVANPSLLSTSVVAGEASTGAAFTIDPVTIDSVVSATVDTINAIGYGTMLGATAYQGTTPLAGLSIQWSTLDPGLADVDGAGQVTGLAVGDARIVATACGSSDTTIVTVRQVPFAVEVSPATAEIEAGTSQQFAATLTDSGGTAVDTATFTWFSSDIDVATVDGTGLASASKSGTVDITAEHVASALSGGAQLNVLLASATSFSMNYENGCALTATNQVVCWGPNPHGIVGLPPVLTTSGNTDWNTPYRPQTIALPTTETYTKVATGYAHACALTSGGDIYCWGSGGAGELGNGSNFDTHTPVLVSRPGGETFTDVTAGNWFTCGATGSGQAYCWGDNGRGQLGTGNTTGQNVPTAVNQAAGLSLFQLTAAQEVVCAIGTLNNAYCWGSGDSGKLGNNNNADSYTPVGVNMPNTTFSQIVGVSNHMFCALGADSFAYCWGANNNGIIDPSYTSNEFWTPQQIGTETFVDLGLAGSTLCGAKSTGDVFCTGANWWGQYGNGGTNDTGALWEAGATGLSVTALDGTSQTMCGLDVSGDIYCWGGKGAGLTGTGDAQRTATPLFVSVSGVVSVAKRDDNTCVLTNANEVYCWGGAVGEFGYSASWGSALPVLVTQPPIGVTFTDLTMGSDHMCALSTTNQVYCIGSNYAGQLGDGTTNYSQFAWVEVVHPASGAWQQVTAGRQFNCALDFSGNVYCWGYNGNGQIGNFNSGDYSELSPVQVWDVGVTYNSVTAGGWHACATTSGSAIYCWGYGGTGQLGNSTYSNTQSTPTQVTSSAFFTQVDAARYHTCGLTLGGEIYCWGRNWDGELGDGSQYDATSVPVLVTGAFTFDQLALAQDATTCAMQSGATKCWGSDWSGVFANGEYYSYSTPQDAWPGYLLTDLGIAFNSACAVTTDGDVLCVGEHDQGLTGVGLKAYVVNPVRVGGSGGG